MREPRRELPDYNYNWEAEQTAAIAAAQEPEEEDEDELEDEDEQEQDEDDEAEADVFLNMTDGFNGTLDFMPDDIASNASSTAHPAPGPEVQLHLGKNRPVYASRPPHTEEEKQAIQRELGRYKRPDAMMTQKDRKKMRVTEKTQEVERHRETICGWRG